LYERVVFWTTKSGKKEKIAARDLAGFFFVNLNNVRKQILLLWEMKNGLKESRKEPKYHKLHEDLTNP